MSWLGRFIQNHVPWKFFFDPKVPWFHPVERRFRRLSKSRLSWTVAITLILWLLSTLGCAFFANFFAASELGRWEWTYALILTSVWFAPIPFSWVAILSIFHVGFENGVAISVCALWVAALQGYWLTRVFPTYLTQFYRASGPAWLPKRLGLRQFPATISVSLDPRISLRSKIAYQGLYCVPIPWFAMNLLVILPSALYFLLRVAHELVPARTATLIQGVAPEILLVFTVYAFVRLVGSSFRKEQLREKKTS
jgi:hypothetical protein